MDAEEVAWVSSPGNVLILQASSFDYFVIRSGNWRVRFFQVLRSTDAEPLLKAETDAGLVTVVWELHEGLTSVDLRRRANPVWWRHLAWSWNVAGINLEWPFGRLQKRQALGDVVSGLTDKSSNLWTSERASCDPTMLSSFREKRCWIRIALEKPHRVLLLRVKVGPRDGHGTSLNIDNRPCNDDEVYLASIHRVAIGRAAQILKSDSLLLASQILQLMKRPRWVLLTEF